MKDELLGKIFTLRRGYDLPHDKFELGNIPVAASNGIIGYHNVSKSKAPNITVGRSGSVGKVHFYNQDIWPHNTSLYVTDFKGNNERYIYYLLKLLDLSTICSNSVVPSLNPNFIYPLKVPYEPKLIKQNKIVEILSSIDRKISLNRRINSTLEAMAKQLYDYWFVQFDFPNEEGKPYKSSGGKMVWNEKLKREIPEGWEVKKINEVANNSCSTITPISGIVYRHYSIPAFDKNNLYDEEDGEYIQSNKYELTGNHIIVSKLNPWINRVVEVSNEKNAICSTEYVPITPEDKRYNSYLKFVVKTDEFISYCVNGSTGTSHSHRRCRPEFIMNYQIPWKEDVVICFNDIIYKTLKKEKNNFSETRHLTSLRDFLLPLLMNGQVTINDK